MQATEVVTPAPTHGPTTPDSLAEDLYAVMVFIRKYCNADLFEAMGALELSMTSVKLLHQIELEEAAGELTLKQVAEHLHVSLPAISRTVDGLVRRGLLSRHEDDADRRCKRVSLTDNGRATIRALNAAQRSGLAQFTQTLDDDERAALASGLAPLLERPELAACRPQETDPR